MTTSDLKKKLREINKKSYGMYKTLAGVYEFGTYQLCIDHVQGDPFASPSRVRLCIPEKTHGFSKTYYDKYWKKVALEDYILRQLNRAIKRWEDRAMGSGKSGAITTCRTGQVMLERIAVLLERQTLVVRLEIGFPARGRTILSEELEKILFEILPKIVEQSLLFRSMNKRELEHWIQVSENQEYIRSQLEQNHLVAFLANGAILPRESGVSERPMKGAVLFRSPETMEVTMNVPYGEPIKGMGIREGITVIAGGGYHGKSTLLKALEAGVYNHIPGDGREYVLTRASAWKVRAEDGRYIGNCNISPFIQNLPKQQNTDHFTTLNASGSTSQAANVIEGIESGTDLFLIDEDTTATNFMIRDQWMSRLVSDEEETITPFIRKIRSLYEEQNISTVIVVGSSGDYLAAANCVIQMEQYYAYDVTKKAKEIMRDYQAAANLSFPKLQFDQPFSGSIPVDKYHDYKIKTNGTDTVILNRESIDLRYLEQLIDPGQVIALGAILRYALKNSINGTKTKQQIINEIAEKIEKEGLISIIPKGYPSGHPVLPRVQEIYGCFNRWRRQ